MPGSTPAEISAEFKKRTGGFKVKEQPVQKSLWMTKQLKYQKHQSYLIQTMIFLLHKAVVLVFLKIEFTRREMMNKKFSKTQ